MYRFAAAAVGAAAANIHFTRRVDARAVDGRILGIAPRILQIVAPLTQHHHVTCLMTLSQNTAPLGRWRRAAVATETARFRAIELHTFVLVDTAQYPDF